MSEAITAYTTTDAIRGAIGITDNEISDAMLTDQRLELELEADFIVWLPDVSTLYADGIAVGATEPEKQTAAHIQLYAQWFCASMVVGQMRLGIPMTIADGKDEMRRFTELDLDEISLRVGARRDLHKARLLELQGDPPVTSAALMSRGIPDYDPVAGA